MITGFASLFEVLIIFNFAFVFSQDFNRSLNERILSRFIKIRQDVEYLNNTIEILKRILFDAREINDGNIDTTASLIEIRNNALTLSKTLDEFTEKSNGIIENSGLAPMFRHACLFSSLHSIFMLVLIGYYPHFVDLDKVCCIESLSIYCALSLMFIIAITYFQPKLYQKVSLDIVIILAFLTIVTFFAFFHIERRFVTTHCPLDPIDIERYWCLPVCLLIPSAHFLYFFIRGLFRSIVISKRLNKDIDYIKMEIEKFRQDLKRYLEFINQYDNFKNKQ